MALTGEEIRARLQAFAARWSVYEGSERGEAQTFLNELFECYGTTRADVAQFEAPQAGRFLDLIWPGACLIEMKAPAEAKRLDRHRPQALSYWVESSDPDRGIPAPRYVVLCAFRRLEIWEPGAFPKAPRVVLDLIDLPDQYDALLFLAGREPVFAGGQAALTREAVVHVADLYERLKERRAADYDVLRDFVLQCVWCMFAEDLGQLPEHGFSRAVEDLIANPHHSSADVLHDLFAWLNNPSPQRPRHGLFTGVQYVNGGLFEQPARVHLEHDELVQLRDAGRFGWNQVQPAIFGSLLEGGLGHDKQWALGAHYTHEADIQKVVQPTIVEPWRERIENLSTHKEAVAAQNDLLNYVVLDPACGSGNFLYVAYRELRRIEQRLHAREIELRKKAGLKEQGSLSLHFPLGNMRGIEIDGFAVALARVTLWMGHKLAVDELGLDESTLPLADLSGIQIGDALRMDWPRADAIVGNPPFHGTKLMRSVLGDDYVDWLDSEFGVGVKDYCVYWFRRTHAALADGARAGLVGTNSIAEGKNREASLDYIVRNGGEIISAVRSQNWPGAAHVHVSVVNWVRGPHRAAQVVLDGEEVGGITTSLRSGTASDLGSTLPANQGRQYYGVVPTGNGFIVDDERAAALLSRDDADYRQVVRPYLVGEDITKNPALRPTRWIIDFGEMPLEQAMQWPAALEIVRSRVKPERDRHKKAREREQWWKFSRTVQDLFEAVGLLARFIACPAQAKRFYMVWCESCWCPSNLTCVFAFDDDGSIGVLTSAIHTRWAMAQSTHLKSDPRYTTASFMTFPWPGGTLDEVADVSRRLYARRSEICIERNIGLTKLYNQVDDGAWADLRELHRELDEAVAAAYGWPRGVAPDPDETNRRLLELNRAIAAGEIPYDPFAVAKVV